jgi:hypothetical protein
LLATSHFRAKELHVLQTSACRTFVFCNVSLFSNPLVAFSVSAMLGTGTGGRMAFSSTNNAAGWRKHEDSPSDASSPSIIIVANIIYFF